MMVPGGCCSQVCHRYPMHSAQFAVQFHHPFFHHSLSSPFADGFKSQTALISLENSMQSVYTLYQNCVFRYITHVVMLSVLYIHLLVLDLHS